MLRTNRQENLSQNKQNIYILTKILKYETINSTFAKRLITLPMGVVSKNIMGTRSMLLSSLECRIRDASIEALASRSVPINTKTPVRKDKLHI